MDHLTPFFAHFARVAPLLHTYHSPSADHNHTQASSCLLHHGGAMDYHTGTAGGNLVCTDFADFAVSFDLTFSTETAPFHHYWLLSA